jgi:hypothetical protein
VPVKWLKKWSYLIWFISYWVRWQADCLLIKLFDTWCCSAQTMQRNMRSLIYLLFCSKQFVAKQDLLTNVFNNKLEWGNWFREIVHFVTKDVRMVSLLCYTSRLHSAWLSLMENILLRKLVLIVESTNSFNEINQHWVI